MLGQDVFAIYLYAEEQGQRQLRTYIIMRNRSRVMRRVQAWLKQGQHSARVRSLGREVFLLPIRVCLATGKQRG